MFDKIYLKYKCTLISFSKMEKQKLRFFKTYRLFKIAFTGVQNSHSFGEKIFHKGLAENKKV